MNSFKSLPYLFFMFFVASTFVLIAGCRDNGPKLQCVDGDCVCTTGDQVILERWICDDDLDCDDGSDERGCPDGGRDDSYSGEYDDDDADCYREAVWSCFPGPGCTLVGFEQALAEVEEQLPRVGAFNGCCARAQQSGGIDFTILLAKPSGIFQSAEF
ncbi:MAG: hypothetical protein R3A47_05855 [Polyangiales bacterium]